MDFLNSGIPLGRYFGINVRLHFTFLLYVFYRLSNTGDLSLALAYIIGLYGCILLHEFGHALAARWCDGEANDILLWPLGGLAMCRPAWNPTAHLITSAAGPFVTLVLAILFSIGAAMVRPLAHNSMVMIYLFWFLRQMTILNIGLLLFNLVPAFPMDGGRIMRDTLWHWMSAEIATRIAVWTSRIIAFTAIALIFVPTGFWLSAAESGTPSWVLVVPLFCAGNYWLIMLAVFILMQAGAEQQVLAYEALGTYRFSLRERWRRGRRQRAFRGAVAAHAEAAAAVGFHRCATCGRTEHDPGHLDFRVCPECADGSEYCAEHIDGHPHR